MKVTNRMTNQSPRPKPGRSPKGRNAKPASTLTLSVLGYREGDEWIAVALEMDLRGYGSTVDEAFEELTDLVTTQLSFARFKGQPEMIWKPAEPIYWRLFADAVREQLQGLASSTHRAENADYVARGLPIPPLHVIEKLSQFSQANA